MTLYNYPYIDTYSNNIFHQFLTYVFWGILSIIRLLQTSHFNHFFFLTGCYGIFIVVSIKNQYCHKHFMMHCVIFGNSLEDENLRVNNPGLIILD